MLAFDIVIITSRAYTFDDEGLDFGNGWEGAD
jgi:hypothetical protein